MSFDKFASFKYFYPNQLSNIQNRLNILSRVEGEQVALQKRTTWPDGAKFARTKEKVHKRFEANFAK